MGAKVQKIFYIEKFIFKIAKNRHRRATFPDEFCSSTNRTCYQFLLVLFRHTKPCNKVEYSATTATAE